MMKKLFVPTGTFAANEQQDAAARQRAILAEKLRRNEEVVVAPSGELEVPDPNENAVKLVAPKGELAGGF